MDNARFPCVLTILHSKTHKPHMSDFNNSRAWILYSERGSYINKEVVNEVEYDIEIS